MLKGVKYAIADNKRTLILGLILGLLFDVANLDLVIWVSSMPIWSFLPQLIALLVAALLVGFGGFVAMVLSLEVTIIAMMILYGIGNLCMRIGGDLKKDDDFRISNIKEEARSQAVFMCSIGVSVAYWIGYKFYIMWIK